MEVRITEIGRIRQTLEFLQVCFLEINTFWELTPFEGYGHSKCSTTFCQVCCLKSQLLDSKPDAVLRAMKRRCEGVTPTGVMEPLCRFSSKNVEKNDLIVWECNPDNSNNRSDWLSPPARCPKNRLDVYLFNVTQDSLIEKEKSAYSRNFQKRMALVSFLLAAVIVATFCVVLPSYCRYL